ncbi:MAG: hypothetical protein WD598_04065 [Acidimicrobiia bacterium]
MAFRKARLLSVALSALMLGGTTGVVLVASGGSAGAAMSAHDHDDTDQGDDSNQGDDSDHDHGSGTSSGSESGLSDETTHDDHGLVIHDSTGGREPTDEDHENAEAFSDDVVEGIAEYEDLEVALDDGYVESPSSAGLTIKHYMKSGVNGARLDPDHPSGLMYFVDDDQATLLGAVWVTQADEPPQPGGPLTVWHDHSAMGCPVAHPDCPAATGGEGAGNPPLMFHVWTFEDAADAFAHDFPGALGRTGHRADGDKPRLPFDE